MTRRSAVIVVVALTVLAGCSGIAPGGNGSAPDDAATNDVDLAEQPWANESGLVFDSLVEHHAATVRNASSLDYSYEITDGESAHDIRLTADHESKRANLSIVVAANGTDEIQQTYIDNTTIYSKAGTSGNVSHTKQESPQMPQQFPMFVTQQAQFTMTPTALGQWEFERAESEENYRFEADSLSATDAENGIDAANVTETDATLVVNPEGYVSELTFSLTQQRSNGTVTVEHATNYSGMNDTTVSEPSWTSKAS